jgi:ABC-type antimicrobial peptide transport system permease subunit
MAVLLAAAGLYGVLAHAVSGRVREIGIRIALGASPGAILGQVVGHALALVAAGIGIGLAAACALTRLIAAQLFQVSPTDPLTFAGVSVVLAAVAAAASFLPARRAVTVNPVAALRCQ